MRVCKLSCLLLLWLLVFVSKTSVAQSQSWAGWSTDFSYFSGKTIKHRPDQMPFEMGPASGFSLELMKRVQGRHYWHKIQGYPRLGVGFMMENFGNDQVLGRVYGLLPQIDLHLIKMKKAGLMLRFGMGIAWVDRPYDRVLNPENTTIGSHVNNMTSMGLLAEWEVFPQLRIRLGGRVTHVSNARYQLPNLGLNTVATELGLSWEIQAAEPELDFSYEKPLNQKILFNIRLGLGVREMAVANGPKYGVPLISIFASRQMNPKSKMILGLEMSNDHAIRIFTRDNGIPNDKPVSSYQRYTAYVGHEFMFGRVGFLTQLFFYLDHPLEGTEFYGYKIGPNFYLFQPHEADRRFNVFVGGYLKAHKAIAQYPEITLGVSF